MGRSDRRADDPATGIAEIAHELTLDVTRLIEALAMAIILSEDDGLRLLLVPDAARFKVALPGGACLEVGGGAPHRLLRESEATGIDLAARLSSSGGLRSAMVAASGRLRAFERAERMLEPWISTARLPSRREVSLIDPWTPVVERLSYQLGARACMLLDRRRPGSALPTAAGATGGVDAGPRHWALLSIQSRMTMLASFGGPAGWLVDMSRSFRWESWTPSFPLVRERSL